MTLSAIFQAILRGIGLSERIINLLNTALQAITGVQNLLGDPAQQHSVEDVLLDTDTIITMLNDPTIGLAAIKAEIDAQAVGILAAILTLPQVGDPVVLPTTPPAGYGTPDLVDVANAVWNFAQTAIPSTPIDALLQTARSVNTTGTFDMNDTAGYFLVSRIDWPLNGFYVTSVSFPVFDPTDILSTETLLDCLTRQNPTWNVGTPWNPQDFVGLDPTDGSWVHWISRINETDFQAIKAAIFPTDSVNLAPIWPGIANVTLGSPAAITAQLTVTGPMDGVIVELTSVSPSKPALNYDTEVAYKFIGALAFVDDNGDVEPFQPLAWSHALYSPLRMTQAASVVLRTDPSVVGTVTPWVIA